MSEDYDVLSMSENDDYADTDASIDDADAAVSDDNLGLSEVDSSENTSEGISTSGNISDGINDSLHDRGSNAELENSVSTASNSIRKERSDTPRTSKDEFDPIASSESHSMYRLPRMTAEQQNEATESASEPDKDWYLSSLDTQKKYTKKHPTLVIAVFAIKEKIVREVISKLLLTMPKARFLWVCTTPERELVASEYIAANDSFDHDPVLPSKRDIQKQDCKLVDIFTYDTTDSVNSKDKQPNNSDDHKISGKHWNQCPAAPVIPVTTKLLGTNELNEKARIISSIDAPLLRSPSGVYTPLTLDYLDMLDADMLLSMNTNGTVACMTTPDKATVVALWPASFLPVTIEEQKEGKLLQTISVWLPTILKVSAMILSLLLLYSTWFNPTSVAVPEPGPQDLQVWEPKCEPSASKLLSHFFIDTPHAYVTENNGVSVAVARSTDALLEYIRYLHLEAIRQFNQLRQVMMLYTAHGRALLNEAFGSQRVIQLKQYARAVGHDLDQTGKLFWRSVASEEAIAHAKLTLTKTSDFRRHASGKLSEAYSKARDSEVVTKAAHFAKDAWGFYTGMLSR